LPKPLFSREAHFWPYYQFFVVLVKTNIVITKGVRRCSAAVMLPSGNQLAERSCGLQNLAETSARLAKHSGGVKNGHFGGAAVKNDSCHLREPHRAFFG
jgi:hypothetical protein